MIYGQYISLIDILSQYINRNSISLKYVVTEMVKDTVQMLTVTSETATVSQHFPNNYVKKGSVRLCTDSKI